MNKTTPNIEKAPEMSNAYDVQITERTILFLFVFTSFFIKYYDSFVSYVYLSPITKRKVLIVPLKMIKDLHSNACACYIG